MVYINSGTVRIYSDHNFRELVYSQVSYTVGNRLKYIHESGSSRFISFELSREIRSSRARIFS